MLLNKVDLVPGNIKSILYTLHYLESILYPLALLLFHMCMHIFLFIVLAFWRFLWLILLRTEVHYYRKKKHGWFQSYLFSSDLRWVNLFSVFHQESCNELFVICKMTIMKKSLQRTLFKIHCLKICTSFIYRNYLT